MSKYVSLLLFVCGLAGVAGGCSKPEENQAPAVIVSPTPQGLSPPVVKKEMPPLRLGQVMPYSGAASAYGVIGKVHEAYFAKVNSFGGIRGHKIEFKSLDDASNARTALEQVRKLVEQEQVVAVFGAVGTGVNAAIRDYLNGKQVPQLFVTSGASRWNDPQHYPWTIGFAPSYRREGAGYAHHILSSNPKAKIAVLYEDDEVGKEVLAGLREGLGNQAKIVAEASARPGSTASVQLAKLRGSKADTFVDITSGALATQVSRELREHAWKVSHYLTAEGAATSAAKDAENGIPSAWMTAAYFKNPTDKRWEQDPAVKEYVAFVNTSYPEGSAADPRVAYAYLTAQTLVSVLMRCGEDLSSKNIMAQAASLGDFAPGLLLPGVAITTSAEDFEPLDQLKVATFDGRAYALVD